MQTNDFELPKLLNKIKADHFRIPQFQREFNWSEAQVKLLVDSIVRNYPMGSLLLIASSPTFMVAARPIKALIQSANSGEVKNLNGDLEEAQDQNNILYVLDGQQRITSIARVFLNANDKIAYYFDLKALFDTFDYEERPSQWIISRKRSEADPGRDHKSKGKLIRSDVVLDQQKTDIYIQEYFEDSGDFAHLDKAEIRKAAAKIKGIFETLRKYRIPAVTLDQDSPTESICRVFETINSTGTRLTTFDLAVARYFPNPDLRNAWEVARDRYSILTDFKVDGERVLQVLSIWQNQKQQNADPSRSALLSIERAHLAKNWDRAIEYLADAYYWARRYGASPDILPNHGILVSIAAFKGLHPEIFTDTKKNFDSILKRWYFTRVFQQGAGVSAGYRIAQDFKTLIDYASSSGIIDNPEVKLNSDRIVNLNKASDSRFKALQCLMAMSAREDLLTGASLDNLIVEDHHIFPRSTKGIDKTKLDSIANRLTVSKDTNRELSDEKTTRYFAELQQQAKKHGTEQDVNRRLRFCFIPGDITKDNFLDQFQQSNFDKFLENRAELLLEKIRELIGDSLNSQEAKTIEDEELLYIN